MKKKAMRKDFYMEIKKSPGRFLSILFIVALGVAFFSGIRASEPDMRITGDDYLDSKALMDIRAFSTYGVTKEDVESFGKLPSVENAEGDYSADFLHKVKEDQKVLHVMSISDKMNQPTVMEGRLPRAVGECLVDDQTDYRIGDEIRLTSGTEDPVSDTLKTDRLTVVGRGSSPCYLSLGRGSASIGTGNLYGFVLVPEETFDQEVYTEVNMQVKGAKELTAFTDDYENKIAPVLEEAETLAEERGDIRKQEIVDEAEEEIADAQKKLDRGKRKAKKKLARAKKKIEDGQKELDKGKKELKKGREELAKAKKTLKNQQKKLEASKKQYEEGKKALKKGKKQYKKARKQWKKQQPAARKQISEGEKQQLALEEQIGKDEENAKILQEKIRELEQAMAALGEDHPQTAQMKKQLTEARKQEAGLKQKLTMEKQAATAAQKQLSTAKKKLEDGEKQLSDNGELLKTRKKQLDKAKEQLDAGQKQIHDAWERLAEEEKKLEDGQKEIEENEGKLKDARKEYKKGKREAKQEIADGEAELADARAELEELEDPKWYVYDRSNLIEYSGFGENAQRLGAIGRVFPVLFFLVAALISLTSITRMVEEQRTSIGTMKALGYGKWSIAMKYIGYALLATVGGSVLGVLVGEKILPYIIIYAYSILYPHLPKILVPYDWKYGLLATELAVFCTTFATFFACWRELAAQPSVLMRPPAPKNGRRVVLEHVSFLWKRLNFTWKSTIRNLMRYKKRFFMTIFGIGGCMALMLVGFGLKDSCYEIAELQYEDIQFYDASIYLEEDRTKEEEEALRQTLRQERNIAQFTDVHMQNITLVKGKKEREAVECVFPASTQVERFVSFHDRKTGKSYALSDQGVIINEKTAKMLEVKVGDTLWIKDEENGNKPMKVAQICENYLGHYLYMTPACYEKMYGKQPEYNSMMLTAVEGCGKEELEAMGQTILQNDGVINVSYIHDMEKQLDDMLRSLNLVIVVLIISAGMLAFVVLYNLNTVNIAERKRELATLKVLGFYPVEVAEYVYRENLLLTLIGAVVGCGLGNILHRFIIETVEVDSVMFGRIINGSSYLYSFLLTVLFSLLINGLMYFTLKKIDMVESLKSVE